MKIIIGLLLIITIGSISGIGLFIVNMNNIDTNPLEYSPSLQWLDPDNGDLIVFGTEDSQFDFKFTYNPNFIDRIELFLNNIFIANVIHKNKVELNYQASFDGQCNATLLGYKNGIILENDTINLVFRKLIKDEIIILDEGEENIGMRPFIILHDPNGDQSYSTVTSNMDGALKIKMGVNGTVKTKDGIEIDADFDFDSFHYPYGPLGYGFDVQNGSQEKMDLLYINSDETGFRINSGKLDEDPEFIGPGLGDRYYGSNWTLFWSFNCRNQTYFNGTEIYSQPFFNYGFKFGEIMSGISMKNSHFPEEWKKYNPALNNFSDADVDWNNVADQLPVIDSTNFLSICINLSISEQAYSYFDNIGTNFTFAIATKMFDVYNTYYIGDDDASDYINNRIGIDKTFGTLIFQNINSITSNPYEYNTTDNTEP